MDKEEIDIGEYEYGEMDLELEEEDEDEDEYDKDEGVYLELKLEENNNNNEDFEKVEELKPPVLASWIDPETGESRRGVDVFARKDDHLVDFEDITYLSSSEPINLAVKNKVYDEPDVCPICYEPWTPPHGNHPVCSLPCGHLFGMSCITSWLRVDCHPDSDYDFGGKCPYCNEFCTLTEVIPLCATRICDVVADNKASTRRFPFTLIGLIEFKKYEVARRNYAWNKMIDASKRLADFVARKNDVMKRRSQLLDRMANVLKRAKALEHRGDNALRRAGSLRLRAEALGRRADEYLRWAKAFQLRAEALLQRARAFCEQVNACSHRLLFYNKSEKEARAAAATCHNI